MPASTLDLLQGTLDLLILRTLTGGELHGWAIAHRIQQVSRQALQINQGSLYPALYRLEERAWIAAAWGASVQNRRARIYRLTPKGRRQLEVETATWERFAGAIHLVLRHG